MNARIRSLGEPRFRNKFWLRFTYSVDMAVFSSSIDSYCFLLAAQYFPQMFSIELYSGVRVNQLNMVEIGVPLLVNQLLVVTG